jgi:hypothetical protein
VHTKREDGAVTSGREERSEARREKDRRRKKRHGRVAGHGAMGADPTMTVHGCVYRTVGKPVPAPKGDPQMEAVMRAG